MPTHHEVAGPGSRTPPIRRSPSACTCFADGLRKAGVGDVQSGSFGAEMAVELVNDGPFTIWLDTDRP